MLFYMTLEKERDVENIPSSYLFFTLSDSKKLSLKHPNFKLLKLMPDITYYKDVKDKKKAFKKKINNLYTEYIIMIASLLYKKSHSESVVIVSTKEENELYGFDIAKVVAKVISKRYDYKCFEFTNTVIRSMRDKSKFSEENAKKLLYDMNSIGR